MFSIKMFLQDLLASAFVHKHITSRFIKDGFIRTRHGWIDVSGQDAFVQSLVFWRLYERKELKVLEKHLNGGYDIIELGSSIGYISLCLASFTKRNQSKMVAVEANPFLRKNLISTFRRNDLQVTVINAAISYLGEPVAMRIDKRNLGSRITSDDIDAKAVTVPSVTLSEVFHSNDIGDYILFCDIEGAESDLFLNERDPDTVNRCKKIIIELHDCMLDGSYYDKARIERMIQDNFNIKKTYSDSNVWVFDRVT